MNPIRLVPLIFIVLLFNSCASLTSTNYASRIRAVNKITDQNILLKVVIDDSNPYVQLAAVNRIADQDLLYRVVMDTEDKEVRRAAFSKISDRDLINKLATESSDWEIRLSSIEKVTDQNILYKIVLQNPPNKELAAAVEKCESENISKFINESIGQELKLRIIGFLKDQKQLTDIAIDNDDWKVRQAAFGKLDESSLDIITREAKDPASVLAANIRLGRTNWKEAFSFKSNTAGKLGDVIGAAALVDDPQPTSYDVVAACHNFIRLGDSSRIPELINLLNRFGDVSLAEDYINCGHDQLYEAGAKWGSEHGYAISTGNGSHRVQWGEKK
jgi:hypothetical protein